MKKTSPFVLVLAVVLSAFLAIPTDILAAPQSGTQRAGEVARVIPAVSIARGSQNVTASTKSGFIRSSSSCSDSKGAAPAASVSVSLMPSSALGAACRRFV